MKKLLLLSMLLISFAMVTACFDSATSTEEVADSSEAESSANEDSSESEKSSTTEESSSEETKDESSEATVSSEETKESSEETKDESSEGDPKDESSEEKQPSSEEAKDSSSEPALSSSSTPSSSSIPTQVGPPAGSPVAKHGFIKRDGNKLVGEHGNAVQLVGMSLFWSQWSGDFYNADLVDWLVDDFKSSIIRVAVGNDEYVAIEKYNPDGNWDEYTPMGVVAFEKLEYKKAVKVIDQAIARGIYVLLDWHDHIAEQYETEAKAFFTHFATEYGHLPNMIYEIYNEPLSAEKIDWGSHEVYMNNVIETIRSIDTKNHIVIGSPNWSSEPQIALASYNDGKINDPSDNVSFTSHFYVDWHTPELKPHRSNAQSVLDNDYPIFATEWGTSDPVDQKFVNVAETESWIAWMKENKVSWCNWSVVDKHDPENDVFEANGALMLGADPEGGWSADDLSDSGKLMREAIRAANAENWD